MTVGKLKKGQQDCPIHSWPQWFEECARHYQDVRMKMAYYEFGKPLRQEVMERIHRDVLQKFPVTKSSTLLDVGGGVGLFSRIFKDRVKRVILTDISVAMLESAKPLDPRGELLACEASALPFRKNTFERVLCYSVFHYLADNAHARKVLTELARVTKPGGMIFVGDVLYPDVELKSEIKRVLALTPTATGVSWPKNLAHNLSKKKFSIKFFLDFCASQGLTATILRQNIPGKATSIARYDVLIKKGR